jgi:flagellum-specific peptidoglycan hydrolase FlgJ
MSKKQAFIDLVLEGAREVQKQTGMFASVTIAQAIHETGWGRSTPKDKDTGAESYNLFGRKAKKGEPFVTSKTWEVYDGKRVDTFAKFKKFNSYTESVLDRSTFLKSKYYKKACSAENAFDACDFLIKTGVFNSQGKEIGYATDPAYAELLKKIIINNDLTKYDLPKNTLVKESKTISSNKNNLVKKEEKVEIEVQKEDADKIIKILQDKWTKATTTEEKKELNRLANVLRKASGQTER